MVTKFSVGKLSYETEFTFSKMIKESDTVLRCLHLIDVNLIVLFFDFRLVCWLEMSVTLCFWM